MTAEVCRIQLKMSVALPRAECNDRGAITDEAEQAQEFKVMQL